MLEHIIVFIGFVKILQFIFECYYCYKRQFTRKPLDLLERYGGKGTWAAVTGASDGIGAEFCKHLARLGFNIVLISRTESKLKEVDK
jgi:17beta-estradiol 17-dehydrogenase / very-long-chain 3-oxoacyl-CoA reductase